MLMLWVYVSTIIKQHSQFSIESIFFLDPAKKMINCDSASVIPLSELKAEGINPVVVALQKIDFNRVIALPFSATACDILGQELHSTVHPKEFTSNICTMDDSITAHIIENAFVNRTRSGYM